MEFEKVLCKKCRQIKIRIQDENYPNKKDKRWIDESGKLWSGKVCPPCNNERMKEIMRNKRSKHGSETTGTN